MLFSFDTYNILFSFCLCMGLQVIGYLLGASLKSDKFTDITYSLTFAILAIVLLSHLSQPSLEHWLIFSAIIVWALRLGAYLLTRIVIIGHDKRFDEMREDKLKFAGFWFFQGITVFVVSLPFTVALSRTLPGTTGILFWPGIFIFATGLIIETVADAQKFRFKNNSKNSGKFIKTGLWAYSRHPNYFGETLVWAGVYICSVQYLNVYTHFAAIGPVYLVLILFKVSGISLLEEKYDKVYAQDAEYQQYKRSTSKFILLPKR